MSEWSLQVLSDVHLEMLQRTGELPQVPKMARFLALCGDIGRPHTQIYQDFIAHVSSLFEHVIIIAGNHEYYGGIGNTSSGRNVRARYHNKHISPYTMREIDRQIEYVANLFPNVTFLQNSAIKLDHVRILGTTLWSYIPSELRDRARHTGNDYRLCYVDSPNNAQPTLLSPEVVTSLHQRALDFLRSLLTSSEPTVILTHHAPTFHNSQDPRFDNDPLRCCYATDLEYLMRPPCVAWCYGHTHWRSDQQINGVRVLSSPMGYQREQERCGGLRDPIILRL